MKKILFSLLTFCAFLNFSFAQAENDFKSAKKLLTKYYQNPSGNMESLMDAPALLESATSSDAVTSEAGNWVTIGEIYSAISKSEFNAKTLDSAVELKYPDAAIKAKEAFTKVLSMDAGKGDVKDAKSGLGELENLLNNVAIISYQDEDYTTAFKNYEATMDVSKIIKDNGGTSRLDEEGFMNDQIFSAAVCGYYAGDLEGAKPYLMKLSDGESDEYFVYLALYESLKETDADKALEYLTLGRERIPDETKLLFTEINHYLAAGKLQALISKLEIAAEKEPNNASVHSTLGNVYDKLGSEAAEAGDGAKASENYNKAIGKYEDAIAIDGNNFESNYGIGAIHYNNAAGMVDDLNALASDLTPAGTKKYDAKKAEMDGLFKKALPYFEKSEVINPQDGQTLQALQEIHLRIGDLTKSGEYKKKVEALMQGQ